MSLIRQFEADAKEEARERYEAGDSMLSIAGLLGISSATLKKYILAWGWPLRPARPIRTGKARSNGEAGLANTRRLAKRVETAVRKQLVSIERRIGADADPADAERDARLLASLVKSLAELARLDAARAGVQATANGPSRGRKKGDGGANDATGRDTGTQTRQPGDNTSRDNTSRDLAELREELAARLRYLRAGRDPDKVDSETVG